MWNEDIRGENGGATYSGYTVFAGETVYAPKDYWDVGYKVRPGDPPGWLPPPHLPLSGVRSGQVGSTCPSGSSNGSLLALLLQREL